MENFIQDNICLICYNSCTTERKDLIDYACSCKYRIHNDCYKEWKLRGTSRLCIICHVTETDYIVMKNMEFEQKNKLPLLMCYCAIIILFIRIFLI
jgi:hypothetical protein